MKKEFQVLSDLSVVQKTSAKVLALLEPLSLKETEQFDIRLCFEEALINAIKHGNGLKPGSKVRVTVEADKDALSVTIEDQGRGFNPKQLADCTRKPNLWKCRGRGIYLIHQLMDQVEYNERGNRIRMVKSLTPSRKRQTKRRIYGS